MSAAPSYLWLSNDSFPAAHSDQLCLMEFNPTKNWGDESQSGGSVTQARMRDSPMHAYGRDDCERRTDETLIQLIFNLG